MWIQPIDNQFSLYKKTGTSSALSCDEVSFIISNLSSIAKLALKAAFFLIRRDLPVNPTGNSTEMYSQRMKDILTFIYTEEKIPKEDKKLLRSLGSDPANMVEGKAFSFDIDLSAAYECLAKMYSAIVH